MCGGDEWGRKVPGSSSLVRLYDIYIDGWRRRIGRDFCNSVRVRL